MKPETMLRLARELDENPYLRVEDRVEQRLEVVQVIPREDLADTDIARDPESGVPLWFVRGLRQAHSYWAGGRGPEEPLEAARVVWSLLKEMRLLRTPEAGRRLAHRMGSNEKLLAEVAKFAVAQVMHGRSVKPDEYEILCGSFPALTDFLSQFLPDGDPEASW